MNRNEDLSGMVNEMSNIFDKYLDLIDEDHMLGILIGLCKAIGENKGYRARDFRKKLVEIINYREINGK